jgi:hypothetical protein
LELRLFDTREDPVLVDGANSSPAPWVSTSITASALDFAEEYLRAIYGTRRNRSILHSDR